MLGMQLQYWDRKRHPERYVDGIDSSNTLLLPRLSRDSLRITLICIYVIHSFVLLVLYFFIRPHNIDNMNENNNEIDLFDRAYLPTLSPKFTGNDHTKSDSLLSDAYLYEIIFHQIGNIVATIGGIRYKWRLLIIAIFIQFFAVILDIILIIKKYEYSTLLAFFWLVILLELSISLSLSNNWKHCEEAGYSYTGRVNEAYLRRHANQQFVNIDG